MRFVICILGVLLILVGLTGLAASIAGIGYAWGVREPWSDEAVEQLGEVERGLTFVKDVSGKAKIVLRKAKTNIYKLESVVAMFAGDLRKKGPLTEYLVDETEEELAEFYGQAKEWVDSIRQSADTARTTLALFSAIPFSGKSEAAQQRSAGLRNAAVHLADISTFLKDLSHRLTELREQKDLEENVNRLAKLLSVLDARVGNIQDDLQEFDEKIVSWHATASSLKHDVPYLLTLAAWTVTALLTWFGIGQVSLLCHGWMLASKGIGRRDTTA